MRNFLAVVFAVLFASWLGIAFALELMDTNFTEWVSEFKQYYFHTKGE
jgi:hypothetical protein